jgi:hypothetical protein
MNTQQTTTANSSVIDFQLQAQIEMFHENPEKVTQLIESGEEVNAVLDASWGVCNNVLIENNEDYASSYWKAVAALKVPA